MELLELENVRALSILFITEGAAFLQFCNVVYPGIDVENDAAPAHMKTTSVHCPITHRLLFLVPGQVQTQHVCVFHHPCASVLPQLW